jgi:N-methylhydantoinase A
LTDKPKFQVQDYAGEDASSALKGERDMYIFSQKAFQPVPVYDGHKMRFGNRVSGPAMIEQVTTAIMVSDEYDCVVDKYGSFALYKKGREDLVASALNGGQE